MKESEVRKFVRQIIKETTEYPEQEWTRVSGYIEGYSALPKSYELAGDGLQDSISDAVAQLQDGEVTDIQVKELNSSLTHFKMSKAVFQFKVEFLYSVHPSSSPEEGVEEVLSKIPGLAKKPAPKTDVSTDTGGYDRPLNESYTSFNPKDDVDVKKLRAYALNGIKMSFDNSASMRKSLLNHVLSDEKFLKSITGEGLLIAADKAIDLALKRKANYWSGSLQETDDESSRLFSKWWQKRGLVSSTPPEKMIAREAWEVGYKVGKQSGKRENI